jgi:hypothetical protein
MSLFHTIGYHNTQLLKTNGNFLNNIIVSDPRPTARTAFKFVAKTERPLVILRPILYDTLVMHLKILQENPRYVDQI